MTPKLLPPHPSRKDGKLHLTRFDRLDSGGGFQSAGGWPVPSVGDCLRWWDEYDMLDNVRSHSLAVADVAVALASAMSQAGAVLDVECVRASALLHDLGKTYCIRHGGNHSQVGAAWAMRLTANPLLSAGVLHHVFWPFELDMARYALPLLVLYSDKRVMHDRLVGVRERFDDLFSRYGKPGQVNEHMQMSLNQALDIETALNVYLGVDLNECTFDSGRLVRRT